MSLQMNDFQKKHYRILSFDGGGIRGVLPAQLLLRLAEQNPKIITNTDLFVGTSVGSFIALALASGMPPNKVVELFSYENTKKIFGRPRPYYFLKPKYSNLPLKRLLQETFSTLRLKDLPYHVVVPAFQLYSEDTKAWGPIFFNNFPSSDTADELVVDVALASSAAPIYFPAHRQCIDGGVIANNPDLVAISYAVAKHAGHTFLKDVVHMSFGTGWNPLKIRRDTRKWGLIQWMYSLMPGISNPKLPLYSVLTDGDVAADMYVSKNLLNERYFRVSPQLLERIHLDDYTKLPALIDIANNYDLFPALTFIHMYWNDEKINFRKMK